MTEEALRRAEEAYVESRSIVSAEIEGDERAVEAAREKETTMKKIAIGAVLAAMVAGGTYVYAQTDGMAGMDHSQMEMGNEN